MNALEKIWAALGLTSERFERLSEAEQANLRELSENQSNLEQDRDAAVSERDAAQARVGELESQLAEANAARESAENTLTEAHERLEAQAAQIAELEAKVTSLNERLANAPAAAATSVLASEEDLPGEKKKKVLQSWEMPLYK